MSGRILVVDDEPALRHALSYALTREGFEVVAVGEGQEGLDLATSEVFDAVVLDIMLPDLSGIDVCRELRARSAVPVLMLTARDSEVDLVLGLEVGADDYLTKPFSTVELVGRIRALLRRRALDRDEMGLAVRELNDMRIDFSRYEVTIDGRAVPLTPSEFRLLALLAEEPGRVFSRREILQHIWNSDWVGDEHACDQHISNLRRKIEDDPRRPKRIVTVRGFGYKLAV